MRLRVLPDRRSPGFCPGRGRRAAGLLAWAALFACAAMPTGAQAITGRVFEDHTGNPVALAEIRLLKPGLRRVVAELETDSQGRFRSPDLPDGEYALEFAKPNYVNATLRAQAGQPLTVRLVRCGAIAGRVTDAKGRPIPGASVFTMVKASNSAVLRPTPDVIGADDRGQYRIYGLPPGQYGVAVRYQASESGAATGVLVYPNNQRPRLFAISGGEEFAGTDFAILPNVLYRVGGKVALPQTGLGFEISLASADQPALSYASQETGKDGSFLFEGIAPGSYELFASGPTTGFGYLGATLEQRAFFGRSHIEVIQNVEGLAITVQESKPVAVVLRAPAGGKPAVCPATAAVTFAPLDAWHIMADRYVDASFVEPKLVDHLAPGRYQVTATKLGTTCYQSGATVVDVGAMSGSGPLAGGPITGGPIAVMLGAAGSIRGKLVGVAAGAAQYAVVLAPEEGGDGTAPVQIAIPDAKSSFAFAALAPGWYRVAVQPAAEGTGARWVADVAHMIEIDVPGGAPTDVEFPAPAAKKP